MGACVANPVSGIDSRKVERPAPSILAPAQLSALLMACGDDAEMLGYVAVGAFAGLRRAEIERLKWQDVNLARGFVTVGAESAKTGRRRLVPVCAALRAWLAPVAKTAGPLAPTINFRRRFHAARKAAGLLGEWEGTDDAGLIPVLLALPRPIFFTHDKDFWDQSRQHAAYCFVWIDTEESEQARYIRAFLRHRAGALLFSGLRRRRGGSGVLRRHLLLCVSAKSFFAC